MSATAGPRIDVLMTDPSSSASQIIEGVYAFGRAHRWQLSLRTGWDQQLIREVRTSPADGFFLLLHQWSAYREVSFRGKPRVAVSLTTPLPHIATVDPDDHAVGRLAAHHLLEEGFQWFAYFGVDIEYAARREAGFVEAIRKAGHEVTTNRAARGPRRGLFPTYVRAITSGYAERFVESLPMPIAVMACTDQFGGRIIDACERVGRRVPADVAVIGVDNDLIRCRFSPITLTSIDTQLDQAGYKASELLHHAVVHGRPLPAHPVLIPPRRVVKRRSTEWLSGDDPDLDQALRYIREHAAEGITIEDVLRVVPLSRTALEQRFKQQLDRTPGEELRRVRLAHVQRLLRNAELTIHQVALRSGFSSPAYLAQFFRQHTGQTPSQFRQAQREGMAPRG